MQHALTAPAVAGGIPDVEPAAAPFGQHPPDLGRRRARGRHQAGAPPRDQAEQYGVRLVVAQHAWGQTVTKGEPLGQ